MNCLYLSAETSKKVYVYDEVQYTYQEWYALTIKEMKQEIEEHCTMEDTLNKLSQLAEIEIPEEEYSEQPGLIKPVEESAEQKAVDSE